MEDSNISKLSLIIDAVEKDDIPELDRLLELHRTVINKTDSYERYTPLIWAAKFGRPQAADVICSRGANVDKSGGWNNSTALMKAVEGGHVDVVRAILKYSPDVNIRNQFGMTALMLAAENGQKEIVEIILANDGIKGINYTNNDSYTALSLAAATGHSEIVRILTALPEISIASVTVFGMNAFMLAAESGSIPTLEILKEKGIDVDAINKFGLSALMLACQHEKGYLKVVQYLCEKAGARVSFTSNNNSALSVACACGNWKIVNYLIGLDSSTEVSLFKDNFSALMAACSKGDTRIVSLLIEHVSLKSLCRVDDHNGDSCLMVACQNGHIDVIVILIDKLNAIAGRSWAVGKVWSITNKDGNTAFSLLSRFYSQHEDQFTEYLHKAIENYHTKPYLLDMLPKLLPCLRNPNRVIDAEKKFIVDRLQYITENDANLYLVRGIVNIACACKAAAELHPSEVAELLKLCEEFETAVYESMFSTSMDTPEYVTKVLRMNEQHSLETTEIVSQGSAFFDGPLHNCVRFDLVRPLATAQIVTFVHGVFYGCLQTFEHLPVKSPPDFFQIRSGCTAFRYSPFVMFVFEGVMKMVFAAVVTVHIMSFSPQSGCDDSMTRYAGFRCDHVHHWEMLIYLLTVTSTLYELGEIMNKSKSANEATDWLTMLSIRGQAFKAHISDKWNILDMVTICFICIWADNKYEYPSVAHTWLSLSAISLSLSMLRLQSLSQQTGQLMLMVFEILSDLTTFFAVLLPCVLGFGIVFHSLFSHAHAYSTVQETFLTLVDAALGSHEFGVFSHSYHEFNGIGLMVIYKILVTIVVLNLIVARMSATHDKIDSNALEVWSKLQAVSTEEFLLLRERHFLCSLPPPFNVLSIFAALVEPILTMLWKLQKPSETEENIPKVSIPTRIKNFIVQRFFVTKKSERRSKWHKVRKAVAAARRVPLISDAVNVTQKEDEKQVLLTNIVPSVVGNVSGRVVSLVFCPFIAIYEVFLANVAIHRAPIARWIPYVMTTLSIIFFPVWYVMFVILILWAILTEPGTYVNSFNDEIQFKGTNVLRKCFQVPVRQTIAVFWIAVVIVCGALFRCPGTLQIVSVVSVFAVQVIDPSLVKDSYIRRAYDNTTVKKYQNLQSIVLKRFNFEIWQYLHALTMFVHTTLASIMIYYIPDNAVGPVMICVSGVAVVYLLVSHGAQAVNVFVKRRSSTHLGAAHKPADISPNGTMKVTVIRATLNKLGKSYFQRKANPYVVVTYSTYENSKKYRWVQYTKTVQRGGDSPLWNDCCTFHLEPGCFNLKLEVFDRADMDSDNSTFDELLYWTKSIDAKTWIANKRFEGTVDLYDASGKTDDNIQLDVKVVYPSFSSDSKPVPPIPSVDWSPLPDVTPILFTTSDRRRIFKHFRAADSTELSEDDTAESSNICNLKTAQQSTSEELLTSSLRLVKSMLKAKKSSGLRRLRLCSISRASAVTAKCWPYHAKIVKQVAAVVDLSKEYRLLGSLRRARMNVLMHQAVTNSISGRNSSSYMQ